MLTLVNLSPFESREVIIQAGGLGEHEFVRARYETRTSGWPGEVGAYTAPEQETELHEEMLEGRYVQVALPPASQITLDLTLRRMANPPSYQHTPWG